jgi:hypothetical protein
MLIETINSDRRYGRWLYSLNLFKLLWMQGKETMYVTAKFEPVRREKIKVWFDDLTVYDSFDDLKLEDFRKLTAK